jgi:hypothetical protein
MKLYPVILLLCLLLTSATFSQVAINTDASQPDNSAMLDVKSDIKGLLLPRMTQAQRNAIPSPATALMIYQTDNTPGYYYNAGTSGSPNWVNFGTQWLYNGSRIYYNAGNVGIGTNTPLGKLHIRQDINAQVELVLENTDPGSNSGERISFNNESGAIAGIMMSDISSPLGANMTLFNNRSGGQFRFNTGGSTKVYIANNGNVGIGNNFTSPSGFLHVNGAEWAARPVIIESNAAGNVGPTLSFKGNAYQYDIIGATGSGSAANADNFAIWDNVASAYRFILSSAGNIGIGSNTPINNSRL